MLIKVFFSHKLFLTYTAKMRFIARVQSHVGNQVPYLQKAFLTDTTQKGLSAKLRLLVTIQAHFRNRVFLTKVGLLTSVPSCMSHQIGFLDKAFLTDTADKSLFRTVQYQMSEKRSVLSKALVTKFAHIGPFGCVYSAVLGKIALLTEDFLADTTRVRLFSAINVFTNSQSSLRIAALPTGSARRQLPSDMDPLIVAVRLPCVARVWGAAAGMGSLQFC